MLDRFFAPTHRLATQEDIDPIGRLHVRSVERPGAWRCREADLFVHGEFVTGETQLLPFQRWYESEDGAQQIALIRYDYDVVSGGGITPVGMHVWVLFEGRTQTQSVRRSRHWPTLRVERDQLVVNGVLRAERRYPEGAGQVLEQLYTDAGHPEAHVVYQRDTQGGWHVHRRTWNEQGDDTCHPRLASLTGPATLSGPPMHAPFLPSAQLPCYLT